MANITGTVIPALSQNDTNTNPHNPMYGIWQAGARGALLESDRHGQLGVRRQLDGAPGHDQYRGAADQDRQTSSDYAGLVSTGQMSTLLPNASRRHQRARVDEAHQRCQVRAGDGVFDALRLRSQGDCGSSMQRRLGPTGIQACSYTKAAYLLNKYPSPGAVDPDDRPVDRRCPTGIFNTTEYQANSDFQKTAAVMKLVIDGDAAAGTIELDGFDYHDRRRAPPARRAISTPAPASARCCSTRRSGASRS